MKKCSPPSRALQEPRAQALEARKVAAKDARKARAKERDPKEDAIAVVVHTTKQTAL